jgi:exoribonuclease-2
LPSIQRVVRSPERWSRIVEIAARLGDRLPPVPDPRALSDFLARRKAADPVHFPDLSLSIVKLLGPGEYAVLQSPEEHLGHFGLAVYSYTHATAPNRRFADLVTQRLLKAMIDGRACPYSRADLEAVAQRCTERENAARKVERLMRKVSAAVLMSGRIGQTFDAIVTGASPKGVYVRLIHPPVEGRVVHGEQGMDVGDHVHVRLAATDPQHGYIDFACGHA